MVIPTNNIDIHQWVLHKLYLLWNICAYFMGSLLSFSSSTGMDNDIIHSKRQIDMLRLAEV